MYHSMIIRDTIKTIKNGFPDIFKSRNSVWLHAIALILNNDYIKSVNTVKLQVTVVETGSACATVIANIYLRIKYRTIFKKYASSMIINRRNVGDGILLAINKEYSQTLAQHLNNETNINT